ncbi:ABC transporter permease [Leptolyngbya sp. 15MV]|nr:ABC transporter permease [Leptolyngbya sp. 15MV]
MSEGAQYRLEEGEGGQTKLVLSGPYLVSTIGAVDQDLHDLAGDYQVVDLSEVTEIDTVGAYVACDLARQHEAEIDGASERAARLMKAIRRTDEPVEIAAPRLPVAERVTARIGEMTLAYGLGVRDLIGFLGQILLAIGSLIRHPSRFRGKALVRQLELVGVSALPIVGLMSFLIGIVIAQQGAVQLSQFGADQ